MLSDLRNQTFHYPSPVKEQEDGWEDIKALISGNLGQQIVMPEGKAKDARYPWAEDMAVQRIFQATGDLEDFTRLASDMGDAVQNFVMAALDLALKEGHVRYAKRYA